uniref:Uncharacterized protein n=1 Tax=Anopheles atroparvus TaxID=41427 RepID=A0A182IP76_ANOAO
MTLHNSNAFTLSPASDVEVESLCSDADARRPSEATVKVDWLQLTFTTTARADWLAKHSSVRLAGIGKIQKCIASDFTRECNKRPTHTAFANEHEMAAIATSDCNGGLWFAVKRLPVALPSIF